VIVSYGTACISSSSFKSTIHPGPARQARTSISVSSAKITDRKKSASIT
jgi:hypothetical protein